MVAMTTINIGAKMDVVIKPAAKPLFATIRATSPLETMPIPTCKDSLLLYLNNLHPIPQPTILVITATITRAIENIMIVKFILGKINFNPILSKKIGYKRAYETVSSLSSI